MSRVAITYRIKSTKKLGSLGFSAIKNKALGNSYALSLVFVTDAKSAVLNKTYRRKNKPTDILAFPLSKKEGEIIIAPTVARRKARYFGRNYENYILFLFIHGLMHLIGHTHGSRMEAAERKIRKQYNV